MSHIESKDLEMYRITPPPPKWDLQEYIRLYVQTGDEKYFYWFLHYYEPQMNSITKGYRKKYGMNEHFADIKQALAVGLCKALVSMIFQNHLFCRMLIGIWSVKRTTIFGL